MIWGIWGVGKRFEFGKGVGARGGGGLRFTNTFITYISKYTYFRVIILIVEKQ